MANIEACTRYKGTIICTCSFIINTLVMGIMLNFGVMLPTFLDEFNAGRTLTGIGCMIIHNGTIFIVCVQHSQNLRCTLAQFALCWSITFFLPQPTT
jgi:drug/metabolite transporter superfamily protein YnfA